MSNVHNDFRYLLAYNSTYLMGDLLQKNMRQMGYSQYCREPRPMPDVLHHGRNTIYAARNLSKSPGLEAHIQPQPVNVPARSSALNQNHGRPAHLPFAFGDMPRYNHTPKMDIYDSLLCYVLTKEQLVAHGYPQEVAGKPGMAFLNFKTRQDDSAYFPMSPEVRNIMSTLRQCCRCKAEYLPFPNDRGVGENLCTYHWGKLRCYMGSSIYSCCQDLPDSIGCTEAKEHVCDSKKEGYIGGFLKTMPTEDTFPDSSCDIVSLDCEMCFTTDGLEVTRVTVMNFKGDMLLDVMVKPHRRIVDYNTRFSGLTADDFHGVTTTLNDVQQLLLAIIKRDTIVVGHGLENDMFGLRLLHEKFVDTAALFPHYAGLPYRRSLRDLTTEHLKREIQPRDQGHDSVDDARACMDLVLYKIGYNSRHL